MGKRAQIYGKIGDNDVDCIKMCLTHLFSVNIIMFNLFGKGVTKNVPNNVVIFYVFNALSTGNIVMFLSYQYYQIW